MVHSARKLIWQDDFDGSQIDRSKWRLDVGYTGETNGELQIYTDRPKNAYLADGCLVIVALEEDYQGYHYTSARLNTQGLQSWTYGRLEARLKIPSGQGLWPAFWMLGDDILTIGWPGCGEIDIMEHIGKKPDTVRGTLHGPGFFRDDSLGADFTWPGQKIADDFHLYALEWEPGEIHWFIDDIHYLTLTANDMPGGWVFDHPFYILLNVAVGGHWPGYPDETTIFPQCMFVDFVRVYSQGEGS
jgi:beta-glucanase (GH16 family)